MREGQILFLIVLFELNFLSRADFCLFRTAASSLSSIFLDTNLYFLQFNSYRSATPYTQR